MPDDVIAELWDFVAQQFRDTIANARPEELDFRLRRAEYSVAELGWRAIGTAYRWSVVLGGATTIEEAVELDPRNMDLLQAAAGGYAPGRFPTSMPAEIDTLLDRADDILAAINAQLMEVGSAEQTAQYRTWWHGRLSATDVAARLFWTVGHADGQLRLLIAYARHGEPGA